MCLSDFSKKVTAGHSPQKKPELLYLGTPPSGQGKDFLGQMRVDECFPRKTYSFAVKSL